MFYRPSFILSPLYTLATDGVPLVADLSHQVVHFLGVCRQLGLVPHGPPGPHCSVVNRLLRAHSFLKLLEKGRERKRFVDGNTRKERKY